MKRVRWMMLVALAAMLSAAAMPRLTGAAPPAQAKPVDNSPPVGKPAPEITGKDLEGNPIKLSDFKGKLVMLDFFGDW